MRPAMAERAAHARWPTRTCACTPARPRTHTFWSAAARRSGRSDFTWILRSFCAGNVDYYAKDFCAPTCAYSRNASCWAGAYTCQACCATGRGTNGAPPVVLHRPGGVRAGALSCAHAPATLPPSINYLGATCSR